MSFWERKLLVSDEFLKETMEKHWLNIPADVENESLVIRWYHIENALADIEKRNSELLVENLEK